MGNMKWGVWGGCGVFCCLDSLLRHRSIARTPTHTLAHTHTHRNQSLEILVETLRRTSAGAGGGGGGVAAGAEESQKRLLVELRRANEEMGRMDVALESRTEEIGALKVHAIYFNFLVPLSPDFVEIVPFPSVLSRSH